MRANSCVRTFTYDAFGRQAAAYRTGTPDSLPCPLCYQHYDQLGSVRMVTDEAGRVVARHDYLPFGEEALGGQTGRTGTWAAYDGVSLRFTGKERDGESGLDYFGARYYSGALGRFTSPDPVNAGADLYNPQSWNGYSYA